MIALLEEQWFPGSGPQLTVTSPTTTWSLTYGMKDQEEINRRARLESESTELEEQLLGLQREISEVESTGPGAIATSGLLGGISVLAYIAAVGIIWPISLMADIVLVRSHLWRVYLVVAFIAGLFALFAFLILAVRRLHVINFTLPASAKERK